jgi:Protein of unknown function (DUF541)
MKFLLFLAPAALGLPLLLSSDKTPEPLTHPSLVPLARLEASQPWTVPFDGLRLVTEATLPNAPDALQLVFSFYGGKEKPAEALTHLNDQRSQVLTILKAAGISNIIEGDILLNPNTSYSSKGSFLSSSSINTGLGFQQQLTCQVPNVTALLPLLKSLEKAQLRPPQIQPIWTNEAALHDIVLTQALLKAQEQSRLGDIMNAKALAHSPRQAKSIQILEFGSVTTPQGPRLRAKVEVVFALHDSAPKTQ